MAKEILNITEKLIEYTLTRTYDSLPQSTIAVQTHCINDIIACMMAATTLDPVAERIAHYAEPMPGNCTILTTGKKTSPEMAALANGALTHSIDFDDSHDALVHPSAVIFPAALALSEHLGNVSGKDFILALVIGTDISCRLAMGANDNLLKYGWNFPCIMEAMGAIFGASKLMGLTHNQILDAIAMTMTQFTCSGESMVSQGSVIRTIREGFAAQAVVQSVLMAKFDIPARFETPFEGKYGFYNMYARGNYSPERIINRLGEFYETENITFKPWPSCKATHTSIQALLDIISTENLSADDIEDVHILAQETTQMTIEPRDVKSQPRSAAMAKASLPFVLGTIIKHGTLDIGSFSQERLDDMEIVENGKKITLEVDHALVKDQHQFISMEVTGKKGIFRRHLETSMGGIGYPLTDEQVRDKFFSCCGLYRKEMNESEIDTLWNAIANVVELENIDQLICFLE